MPEKGHASSPAQRERVRKLLSKGYTPREIALRMGISTQAVYKHMKLMRGAA